MLYETIYRKLDRLGAIAAIQSGKDYDKSHIGEPFSGRDRRGLDEARTALRLETHPSGPERKRRTGPAAHAAASCGAPVAVR